MSNIAAEKKPMLFDMDENVLEEFRTKISSEDSTQMAYNACFKSDIHEVCLNRKLMGSLQHVFSHKVEAEGKPMTNQKLSGRCWLFAALNVMRQPFCKQLNIDEFEFSQAHLFFWDKIERSNHFLNSIVECFKSGEEVDGRLVSFLLQDPTCDGGQWDMLVNLITKYGVMPKKCFPESFSSESSNRMNSILKSKLREFTSEIQNMMKESDCTDENVKALIKRQMEEVFRIAAITVGVPPKEFTWHYYEKNKTYQKIGPITPLEFFNQHVNPLFHIENKVCLVNDPRPFNPYGKLYSVKYLGNMTSGKPTVYNNQPIEVLMKASADSITNNESVWFGCEISKSFSSKYGIQAMNLFEYKTLFGSDVFTGLSKADRLIYGDSLMTHAMTLTGVHLSEDNKDGLPTSWRVENSWGEDRGDKGYHLLTRDWFREFVFEIVVDKAHVPQEVLDVFKTPCVELPAWDPMGALAGRSQ